MNSQMVGPTKARLHMGKWHYLLILLTFSSVCSANESLNAQNRQNPPSNAAEYQYGEPDDGIMKQKPMVESLGNEQYRVGAIQLDKARRLITVPGKMLTYEPGKAIEFIATTNQGFKAYESVLALDVNAFEFNLACILIGLDSKNSVLPKYHFDPQPVPGDRVSISVSWMKNDEQVEMDVIDLLKLEGKKPSKPSVWSYTGSMFTQDNHYLAQMDGVLIGLIHDPASIIEHTSGLGLGNWGAIIIDTDRAPAGGQALTLSIQFVE